MTAGGNPKTSPERRGRCWRSGLAAIVAGTGLIAGVLAAAPAAQSQESPEAQVTEDHRVEMSDGVELLVRLGGRGPLADGQLPARPVIVEFSPYAPGCCAEYGGSDVNYLQVHIRGTGSSGGGFDALGPRSQQDVAEVLEWACAQPWSNGRLGLWGFSASAIMAYNSMHLDLPCLETAVLGSGTFELYRDLLYIGGIPNGIAALGVFAMIGGPTFANDRWLTDPVGALAAAGSYAQLIVDYLITHPSLDDWWHERGFRGDVNEVPILMVDGFFDVESRGAFQAFQELRDNGAHLYVVGAHDGIPAGAGEDGAGAAVVTTRWFDRYLRDVDNGVDGDPTVQLWLANGSRTAMLAGDFVTEVADDWPVPGTTWTTLHLDAAPGGTGQPVHDGSLVLEPAPTASHDAYVPVPSLPTATDPYTTSLLGVLNGTDPITELLTTMTIPELVGLSYTTGPLAEDVRLVGPASAEVVLTSLVPESDLWAVISDVSPGGTAHPMAIGRLRTSYPDIVEERSLVDDDGHVVQPYGDFSAKRFIAPGTEHRYHVEFFPIGNQFKAGHRIRLDLVGASLYNVPTLAGPNLVRVGGGDGGSLLRLPVLPGSDLGQALGQDGRVAAADGVAEARGTGHDLPTGAVAEVAAGSTLPRTGTGHALPAGLALVLVACATLAATRVLRSAPAPRR